MRKPSQTKQSGQILVLMAMMSTTLVILFGFVVGIGHLIQARVNLQNAVDLAAMSGASWQARFLNHIALVNYRLRQNYKFVLYDLYVTQSRFNPNWGAIVRNGGATDFNSRIPTSQKGVFGICQQSFNYEPVAAIGETGTGVDSKTDMCKNVDAAAIPPINVTPPIMLINPGLAAAFGALQKLDSEMKRICSDSAGQNEAYFNFIMKNLDSRQDFQMGQFVELLNKFHGAFSNNASGDLDSSRTADATMLSTFQNNLIGANSSGVELIYLNPPKTRSIDKIVANTQLAGLDDYFEFMMAGFIIPVVDFQNAGGCRVVVTPRTSPLGIIDPKSRSGINLGISRARSGGIGSPIKVPFHIALQASVTPNILFWPRSLTPKLVAISAAKPFGSRIAPSVGQSNIEVLGVENLASGERSLANMSLFPGDLPSGGLMSGIGHVALLQSLYRAISGGTLGPVMTDTSNGDGLNRGRPSISNNNVDLCQDSSAAGPPFLCFALSPTVYESLFWSTFVSRRYAENRSVQAMLPFEFFDDLNKNGNPDFYWMKDRESPFIYSNVKSAIDAWHTTVIFKSDLKQGGKPYAFADETSILSAWTPSFDPENQSGKPDRVGYQIKMISLQQVCQEMRAGGVVNPSGRLSAYCNGSSAQNGVFL